MSPTIASGDAHDVYTAYLARRETRYQQIAAFQAALDAHADAVEDELLNDLRVLAGEPTNVPTTVETARTMLNLLTFFPELCDPAKQLQVLADPPLFPKSEEPEVKKSVAEPMPTPPPREPERSLFPHLTRVARDKSMLVVGGPEAVKERIEWARGHGIEIDWVPINAGRAPTILDTVVKMIAEKDFMGAIVLDGEVDEAVISKMRHTCVTSGTPMSYAKKGSSSAIWQAFDGIERAYAQKEALARVA